MSSLSLLSTAPFAVFSSLSPSCCYTQFPLCLFFLFETFQCRIRTFTISLYVWLTSPSSIALHYEVQMKIPRRYIHFILRYSLSEPKFMVMYFDTSLLFLLHENMHFISSLVNKRGSMNSFFLLVYFVLSERIVSCLHHLHLHLLLI